MPGLLRFRLGKRYLTVLRWTGGIANELDSAGVGCALG